MTDPPTFKPLALGCQACGQEWEGWQPVQVPISTWVAHVRTIQCPRCKSRKLVVVRRSEPIDG